MVIDLRPHWHVEDNLVWYFNPGTVPDERLLELMTAFEWNHFAHAANESMNQVQSEWENTRNHEQHLKRSGTGREHASRGTIEQPAKTGGTEGRIARGERGTATRESIEQHLGARGTERGKHPGTIKPTGLVNF